MNINIVGAGLAGSEAAFQLAEKGFLVNLFEMRDLSKNKSTQVHQTEKCAELVCSNSFRNDDIKSGIGLLHEELRQLNSLILQAADANKVPAGGALAVDREIFSDYIHDKISNHKNITIIRKEITEIPNNNEQWIIATGPLTSEKLFAHIETKIEKQNLYFYDSIAPIIHKDSIDFSKAWFQSRYDKGDGKDYINCPLTKEQYETFIDDLLNAEKAEFHDWEKPQYFEGCLPIEVMAERGKETLRFGPMKPVGLTDPNSTEKSYAIIQLRQDNKLGTLYNIVGFQTKMKHGEQIKTFKKIPGLENAKFARLGGIHRNSFINSPELLDSNMRLRSQQNIMFAGQVTGVEGYVESASMGLLAAIFTTNTTTPPIETAIGSLLNHITTGHNKSEKEKNSFQPMNVNFGLFPMLDFKHKKNERKQLYAERALKKLEEWKSSFK